MKRFIPILSSAAVLALPQLATAQSPGPIGNNPTTAGIYLGGALGISVLEDVDFEGVDAETDVGFLGSLALGYGVPSGPMTFRGEAELALRANVVDEFADEGAEDNSDVSSAAGMLNAYLDYYILPNTAITVGAGIGYATVQADIAANDVSVFDEENDSGFAYQGRLGARYDFGGGPSVNVGYTYFAVDDLKIDNEIVEDEKIEFDYLSHSFHVGFSYAF